MTEWRYDGSPPDAYVDALLDAVEARDQLAARYADHLAEDLTDELARIVAVAARADATAADVEAAIKRERIDRLVAIATLVMAEDADELAAESVRARARAVVAGGRRDRAVGPIRKADMEARAVARLARGDGLVLLDADPPRLLVGGRVPSPEQLARMTDAELNLLLRRFGASRDRAQLLSVEVRRASMRLVGADAPDDALVEAVLGRAEQAVRRHLRVAAKDLVRRYEQGRIASEPEMPMRWVAVLGGKGSCPSCETRNGQVQTMREWEGQGEPGSDNLLCGPECRCRLEPDVWFRAPSAAVVDDTLERRLAA